MRVRRDEGYGGWLEWAVALAVLLLGGLIVLFVLAVLATCQGPVCPNCSQPVSPPAAASPAVVTIPVGGPAAGTGTGKSVNIISSVSTRGQRFNSHLPRRMLTPRNPFLENGLYRYPPLISGIDQVLGFRPGSSICSAASPREQPDIGLTIALNGRQCLIRLAPAVPVYQPTS